MKKIEIELTEEEYLQLQYVADMKGLKVEFIAEMGLWIYWKRLERNLSKKEKKVPK